MKNMIIGNQVFCISQLIDTPTLEVGAGKPFPNKAGFTKDTFPAPAQNQTMGAYLE